MRRFKSVFLALGAFAAYYIIVGVVMKQSTCIIRNTTGIPCPGCGMTRSYIHLLHGDVGGAYRMHPLFWLVPILVFFAGSDYFVRKKGYMLSRPLRRVIRGGIILCLVLFVGVYVYRMLVFFPHTEPMVFNDKGLWPQVLQMIMP